MARLFWARASDAVAVGIVFPVRNVARATATAVTLLRQVTLKDENGEVSTLIAGPEVRNFNQIHQGDKVALHYRETVTILGMSGVKGFRSARGRWMSSARRSGKSRPAARLPRLGQEWLFLRT